MTLGTASSIQVFKPKNPAFDPLVTRRIQRLFPAQPISKNLSPDSTFRSLFESHFMPDYMGATEFEGKALPSALSKIGDYVRSGQTQSGKLDVDVKFWPSGSKEPVHISTPVYYLCDSNDVSDVLSLLPLIAHGNHQEVKLQEPTLLANCAAADRKLNVFHVTHEYVAWIDLTADYMFFRNIDALQKAKLFFEQAAPFPRPVLSSV